MECACANIHSGTRAATTVCVAGAGRVHPDVSDHRAGRIERGSRLNTRSTGCVIRASACFGISRSRAAEEFRIGFRARQLHADVLGAVATADAGS